jgi:hypothetical protein
VRVVDAFVDELDLAALGFTGIDPKTTGRLALQSACGRRAALEMPTDAEAGEAAQALGVDLGDRDMVNDR